MKDESKYRKNVGMMLLNSQGKVFAGQRFDTSLEAWQMPQGGIDEGETPEAAMKREMLEEVGTDKFEIITISDNWLFYDLPKEVQSKFWGGKYLGQMQKWYLLRFTGEDSDINLETEEPEFKNWQWVTPQDLPDMIVPFKRDLYRQVLKGFESYL